MKDFAVYVERGKKRVFAGALEWPGWCRSARDEDGAVQTLFEYAARYADAVGPSFKAPRSVEQLVVTERLEGDTSTDFGVPAAIPETDQRSFTAAQLNKHVGLLESCWQAFDDVARRHKKAALRKGPRGGGRELEAIIAHVLEGDSIYLYKLGGRLRREGDRDARELRGAFLEVLRARARGEEPETGKRRAPLWPLRYAIRRSAWHALDHAWEIEDRVG